MPSYPNVAASRPPPALGGKSRHLRTRALVFMVVALATGLLAALLVVQYAHRGGGPVSMARVVVAAADIPEAVSLTPELLKVVEWPASVELHGSFGRVDDLAGRVASHALVAGEPIVEGRLSPKGAAAGMAALIPSSQRAMTVPVNEVVGVGGFIHPGDIVDVITTMLGPPPTGPGTQDEYRSKIVLQNIHVLAVGEHLSSTGDKAVPVPAVTLLVSPDEAERLALASTQGKLQLTMRSHSDNEQVKTLGVSPPELLGVTRAAPTAAPSARASREPERDRDRDRDRDHDRADANARPASAIAAPTASPAPSVEVIEVFHGDRIEQRKYPAKAAPR